MSYEKDFRIVDNVLYARDVDYVPDPRGVGFVLSTYMQKYSERIFQIYAPTGESETYGSFYERCVRAALVMRSKGLKPNDSITIYAGNHLDSSIPFFASLFLGVLPTYIDVALAMDEVVHLLKYIDTKILFIDPDSTGRIEEILNMAKITPPIVVFGDHNAYTPFSCFLKPCREEKNFQPFEVKTLKDTMAIWFSSGTSGLPKGICVNHYAFLVQSNNTINLNYCLDVTFTPSSLYWGIMAMFWAAVIMTGKTKLIYPDVIPENFLEMIDKYKTTFMFADPLELVRMCSERGPEGFRATNIKHIVLGGYFIIKEQMLQLRELLPDAKIVLAYGQTESIGHITGFALSNPHHLKAMRDKPESSGYSIPGISYKILDLDTKEVLGPNQPGEIRIKTDLQMNGYYKVDSSDAWDSDGWLITGDIGYYDQDGCFYIVDRIKEMFMFRGYHVIPSRIESVLLTHPFIKRAVVIGKRHEIDCEQPMAVVELTNPDSLSEEDIIKYVDERVDDTKRLRGGVNIIYHMPLTPTGKVKRREVRKMFLSSAI